jgi:hypothetical protein
MTHPADADLLAASIQSGGPRGETAYRTAYARALELGNDSLLDALEVRVRDRGEGLQLVAAKLGVSQRSVARWCDAAGIHPPVRKRTHFWEIRPEVVG